MSDLDELAADLSPVSEQLACDATLGDDPSTLTARLEALLDQIDAEEPELVRGPLIVEAVLSARSAVAQWTLLQERSAAIVEDPVTDKLNGLVTRLLSLPGAPRGLALKDIGPVVRQVHPERHLDGVEELKAAYARHVEALKSLTSVNGRLSTAVGPNGAQMLVDEALHRLEIERISQARDPLSLVKKNEPVRVDPLLPPWLLTIDQVRQGPPIDWINVADAEVWPRLSTRDRAEAVSDLVRWVVEGTPEKLDRIQPSDLVSAANGDVESWKSLRFVASTTSSWASTLDPSRLVVPRFVFASRSDLTPAQRGHRDFLHEQLNEIDQRRRELAIDDSWDEVFPGDPKHDRQAVLARQAARMELHALQRDAEAALQEYSVLPRRSIMSPRHGSREVSTTLAGSGQQASVISENTAMVRDTADVADSNRPAASEGHSITAVAGSGEATVAHAPSSSSQADLHPSGVPIGDQPNMRIQDGAVVTPGDEGGVLIDEAATKETAAADAADDELAGLTEDEREARDTLRYQLGAANYELRARNAKNGKRSVTQQELAGQIGWSRQYIIERARRLRVNLKPFTLLYGPPVFDPSRVIEVT